MAPLNPSSLRVIVRLPYNRPEESVEDPPRVEWTTEKETILWEVIARSRSSDSGGLDWQGLSAHLQIPLPYLLYRAQARYEQDLRGLQDIKGAFSPEIPPTPTLTSQDESRAKDRPDILRRISGRIGGSTTKLSSSTRLSTPIAVRAGISLVGNDSHVRQGKDPSSSTLTLQGHRSFPTSLQALSSNSFESQSESDEEAEKAEAEERRQEEEEALDKKLQDLQKAMTHDALGFVREARRRSKGKEPERGREGPKSPKSPLRHSVHSRDFSASDTGSASATTSPQGSIPSIPSPSPDSQPHSPISRHLSPAKKSSSPPVLSTGNARGQSHKQFRPIIGRTRRASEKGSNQGSTASSFSDISDADLSASALESALLSNIRGGSSRLFSVYPRSQSQFGKRTSNGSNS